MDIKTDTIQATEVLTTIAKSFMVTQRYPSIGDALRALAISEVERKITKYRRQIHRLQKKYGKSLEEFTADLQGKANIDEEDAWFEWQSAMRMLEDWEATKAVLLHKNRHTTPIAIALNQILCFFLYPIIVLHHIFLVWGGITQTWEG